jgi:hypothetical protein
MKSQKFALQRSVNTEEQELGLFNQGFVLEIRIKMIIQVDEIENEEPNDPIPVFSRYQLERQG